MNDRKKMIIILLVSLIFSAIAYYIFYVTFEYNPVFPERHLHITRLATLMFWINIVFYPTFECTNIIRQSH